VLPAQSVGYNRALAVKNLAAVWANFYDAGVRRVILARIIESVDDIQEFGGVIPNAQITVCLLQVPAETVQRRLTEREQGSARAFLLNVTEQIADRIANLDLPGIRVENGQRPLNAVAREILQRAGWPCPPE
jgi:adenylylsulfate kinase